MRLIVLAACAALAFSAPAAWSKTLVFCSEGNPETLSPHMATTTTGMNATRPIFNNLVEFTPGTSELVPALAERWTVSPDGQEYIFHLRRGVRFHTSKTFQPTREMNADDVVFSLTRQWKSREPATVSGFVYFGDMGMPDLLQSIDKVDDHTVRIRLARPEAPFLADMAMPFAAIYSAEYAAALEKAGTPDLLDTQPIGTGPFMFAGFTRDVAVRFRAFPGYWRGSQPLDNLVFSITPNATVRLTKLKAGECHVMAFPSPDDVAGITADPSLVLLRQEGLNIGYMAFNTLKPPFDDARVRRAINMAVDKKAIIESVYGGVGAVAKNPIPPTLWSYDDSVQDYPYDPDGARRLLAEAGFPAGFETDLWYMPVSRPYIPDGRRVAEMLEADLARVGVRLRLATDEWSAYRTKLQAGEHTMALFGWTGDNGDPDNFLQVLLSCLSARPGGSNVARWCDPSYDALVTRAKLTAIQAERSALYGQAQKVFKDQAPWVPLAHSVVLMAARKEVAGFLIDPLGRHIFEGVDLR
ncbi:ABC transporter substrate-binding protein [Terrihabitans sp. PJ23]|uniref:ABC transporter substrate-binding protein n=1 Tax=Terrihabitans rhizophilus TaxID=3092662 RepID=A0ABU4RUD5_9HYPH|nr:ABC transporter substrate-binding protein [Terrihabitans sp. PJ23]MDX6806461.1 ABC transporter substrate-binding protein [Terrihabitans sp. PJ23]